MATQKTVLKSAFLLLGFLALGACHKEEVPCLDDAQFCALIAEQNFAGAGPLVDGYLATLREGNEHEKLERLKDWLGCKSCVSQVEITCWSCVYSIPSFSELKIDFALDGHDTTVVLVIRMVEPVQFSSFRRSD